MNKGGTAVGGKRIGLDQNIVNMTTSNFNRQIRTQTAGISEVKKRSRLPKNGSLSTLASKNLSLGGTGMKPQQKYANRMMVKK